MGRGFGSGFGSGFASGLTAGASLGSVLRGQMDKSDLAEAMKNETMEDKTSSVEVNAPDAATHSKDAETGNYVPKAFDDQGGLTEYGKQIQNASEENPVKAQWSEPQYETKTERVEKQFASPNEKRLAMLQGGIDHYLSKGETDKSLDLQQRLDQARLSQKQEKLVDVQVKGAERTDRQNEHVEKLMDFARGHTKLSDDEFLSGLAGLATNGGDQKERFAYGTDPQTGQTFIFSHHGDNRKVSQMFPVPKVKDGALDRESMFAQTLPYFSPEAFQKKQEFDFKKQSHQDEIGLKKQGLAIQGANLGIHASANTREQEKWGLTKTELSMVNALNQDLVDALDKKDDAKYKLTMQKIMARKGQVPEEDKGKFHATSISVDGIQGALLYNDKRPEATFVDNKGQARPIAMPGTQQVAPSLGMPPPQKQRQGKPKPLVVGGVVIPE